MYTSKEYKIYLKVQHESLLEDARNFVADYLADKRGVDPFDIEDDEIEKYDLDYLVTEYERRADRNVAFNDTWESVVREYMYDHDDGEA